MQHISKNAFRKSTVSKTSHVSRSPLNDTNGLSRQCQRLLVIDVYSCAHIFIHRHHYDDKKTGPNSCLNTRKQMVSLPAYALPGRSVSYDNIHSFAMRRAYCIVCFTCNVPKSRGYTINENFHVKLANTLKINRIASPIL